MKLEELGNAIRDYRTRLGFTQNELASALQVSPQAVSKWERGENAPDISALPELSGILGVSIDTLLGSYWRDKRTVEATVMFADMADFSALAKGRDPADLAIDLNAFFYPLTERVLARDGLPIKYIGDELLCVFAGEGHRLRAVRAALEAKGASPRRAYFAIATGPVWMGPIGHPAYARPDVLGGTVNLAACLTGWAKKKAESGVAASASTLESLQSALELGFAEDLSVFGSATPIRAYEIIGLH